MKWLVSGAAGKAMFLGTFGFRGIEGITEMGTQGEHGENGENSLHKKLGGISFLRSQFCTKN